MTETVTLAHSELRGLITKAARGAGLSWGLAEEAGWAAEWLARRGMPAADWATLWLADRMAGAISPVEIGVSLADACMDDPATAHRALPDGLAAPGYLLPFLHRIAGGGPELSIISAQGLVARVSAAGEVVFGQGWHPRPTGWRLSATVNAEPRPGLARRPVVSRSVIECLEDLALRTTVPRSETSRHDAGSSGSDND
ncbi:DUF3726 domain-containing protein [Szabonella alba]|uniref:DUF3726 domain-containing protein n=1 Tax=Szabonella alba TaxID=2804194 RepID=A0A8K0VB72_9RHOB|nr:DUF3726 domain-containing protein [Szabonella alba]MBL4916559.1 DUF3726 domain-containing protein [Szabonella alba]